FSSQDERRPGKEEEEIGKDGAVWTVVGEEESRGRHQSQNALTKRQIQDAQTAFLCSVDAEMLIHVQGCRVAEARKQCNAMTSSPARIQNARCQIDGLGSSSSVRILGVPVLSIMKLLNMY
ncbi:hypothetical protein AMECASPLE_032458, partial [Ameca splendens]